MGKRAFKILERRKLKTVYTHYVICSCGKKFLASISYYSVTLQYIDTGELKRSFSKVVHDYPRITCHCRCGAKWGEHEYDDLYDDIENKIDDCILD